MSSSVTGVGDVDSSGRIDLSSVVESGSRYDDCNFIGVVTSAKYGLSAAICLVGEFESAAERSTIRRFVPLRLVEAVDACRCSVTTESLLLASSTG